MGFSLDISVPAAAVFLQGILSFFSPCVLPLLPVYMGWLAGGAADGTDLERGNGAADGIGTANGNEIGTESGNDAENGTSPESWNNAENGTNLDSGNDAGDGTNPAKSGRGGLSRRGRIMAHTFCFVLGVSFAIFLLGLGFTAAGQFLRGHTRTLSRLGGAFILLLGLYQLGAFGQWSALERERRLPFRLDRTAASAWTALCLGFVFSFAWTPCVGPALASVLLLSASAATRTRGLLLTGLYTLGFALPFLGLGLFTDALLDLTRRHRNAARYAAKAGGFVLLAVGLLLLTGWMDGASPAGSRDGNLSGMEETLETGAVTTDAADAGQLSGMETPDAEEPSGTGAAETPDAEEPPDTADAYPAPDFTLPDQYGVTHSLSDYRGKVVFLNFWATWCPPCRAEMPDIQSLYERYAAEGDGTEVIILGVAAPGTGGEKDAAGVASFLEENGYTYPVVMDASGNLLADYAISAFPTTFMIDRAGNIYGYVEGSLPQDVMEDIIRQTLEGGRN